MRHCDGCGIEEIAAALKSNASAAKKHRVSRGAEIASRAGTAICGTDASEGDGNGIMKHLSEEQLIAYQDGEPARHDEFAAHLEACGDCRTELERIAQMLEAFQALRVPDPGEDYGRRVWQQIAPRWKKDARIGGKHFSSLGG